MGTKSAKSKLFSHLLPQHVAKNNAIDHANKVELIQSFVPNAGFFDIIIKKKKKAMKEAKKYRTRHVLWVDKFKLSRRNVAAIVY